MFANLWSLAPESPTVPCWHFLPSRDRLQGGLNGRYRVKSGQDGVIGALAANDALRPSGGSAILRGDRLNPGLTAVIQLQLEFAIFLRINGVLVHYYSLVRWRKWSNFYVQFFS